MQTSGPIVVGHDGSPFADSALTWALELATRTGNTVQVVRGWSIRSAPRPDTWERGYVPPESDFAAAVTDQLRSDVESVVSAYPQVSVEYVATHGPAANGLLDLSAGASLVVVGPRGLGGFKGLVLGSVSEQVVRHAKCPVVVVRGDDDPADSDRTRPLAD